MIFWYKPIEDSPDEQRFVTDCEELGGRDWWDFQAGELVRGWSTQHYVQCTDPDADGIADDALRNHLGVPIFSSRLVAALERCNISGIQYLPIRVLHSSGSEIQGYSIANFTNLVPALEVGHSDVDRFDPNYFIPDKRGKIAGIRKAVLNASILEGLDAIRLAEFPVAEFVSENFVRAYVEAGCTGYEFCQIEVVTDDRDAHSS